MAQSGPQAFAFGFIIVIIIIVAIAAARSDGKKPDAKAKAADRIIESSKASSTRKLSKMR